MTKEQIERVFSYAQEAVLQFSLLATVNEKLAALDEKAATAYDESAAAYEAGVEIYRKLQAAAPGAELLTVFEAAEKHQRELAAIDRERKVLSLREAIVHHKYVNTVLKYATVINPYTADAASELELLNHIAGLHDTIDLTEAAKEGVKDATD